MKELLDYRSIPESKYLAMERRIKALENENKLLKDGASVVYYPNVKIVNNYETRYDYRELFDTHYRRKYSIEKVVNGELKKDEHYKKLIKYIEEKVSYLNNDKVDDYNRDLERKYKEQVEKYKEYKKQAEDKYSGGSIFVFVMITSAICYAMWG